MKGNDKSNKRPVDIYATGFIENIFSVYEADGQTRTYLRVKYNEIKDESVASFSHLNPFRPEDPNQPGTIIKDFLLFYGHVHSDIIKQEFSCFMEFTIGYEGEKDSSDVNDKIKVRQILKTGDECERSGRTYVTDFKVPRYPLGRTE